MSDLSFDSAARSHLESLREHPFAPAFNFASSDLLNRESLLDVKRFAQETAGLPFWSPGGLPEWLPQFLQRVFREVPHYREFGGVPSDFQAIPTVSRSELSHTVERLIPDDFPLSEVTVYTTSGTTGTSLAIPTDAAVSSKTLVLIEMLLRRHHCRLPRGSGKVALAVVFCQQQTLTYPSLSHYLDGAAAVKVNLHPSQWKNEKDAGEYLLDLQPAVLTGCPHSFKVLADLAPGLRPLALFSSAEALMDGLRRELEEVFQCPVIDVYSLTEAKFIAADSGSGGHDLIAPDLYLEILDEDGRCVPLGERGEITITGGRNRCLPLVRYRTGDFGALAFRGRQPYLLGLQGRAPVELVDGDGEPMSSLDVTHALKDFPLSGFSFAQSKSGDFVLEYLGECDENKVQNRLREVTGLSGRLRKKDSWSGKLQQFKNL